MVDFPYELFISVKWPPGHITLFHHPAMTSNASLHIMNT